MTIICCKVCKSASTNGIISEGRVTDETKEEWMVRQRQYLIPLIQHQMYRTDSGRIPIYICALFRFFCDNKTEYIDLSCINGEIKYMDKSLQTILLRNIGYTRDGSVTEYKINEKNLKLIFPKLVEYKNHLGYWIHIKTSK